MLTDQAVAEQMKATTQKNRCVFYLLAEATGTLGELNWVLWTPPSNTVAAIASRSIRHISQPRPSSETRV